jgi:MFS family permease
MTDSRRLAVVIGFTQTLAWATTYYAPAVLIGPVSASMGVSSTTLLGGYSWSLLIAGLCSPRIGSLIDRAGGRGVLASGAVVMSAGLALMAALPTLPGWYLAWTVIGVGMALGLYDAAFATIGRLLGSQSRPCIVGATLMAGFASTVGWPMGAWLIQLSGWRTALMIYVAIQMLVNLPLILTLIPRAPPLPPPAPGAAVAHAGGFAPGMRLGFWLLAIFFSVRQGISVVVSVHVLTLLHGIGLTAAAAVGVAALIGPSQVGGRVLEWVFARWLNPVTTGWVGAALLPLGVVGLLFGGPAAGFAIAYGMSNGILTISRGTLPLHLFGPAGYATRLGKLALPQLITQAISPTLFAPVIAAYPAEHILTAIGILAFLVWLCLIPLARFRTRA